MYGCLHPNNLNAGETTITRCKLSRLQGMGEELQGLRKPQHVRNFPLTEQMAILRTSLVDDIKTSGVMCYHSQLNQ